VTFSEGATVLGTGTLNGTGQASFTTAALSVGTHVISASYGGDGNFNTSATTGTLSQVVNKANTSTVITSAASPAFVGSTVTFTATIVPTAPGAGVPTGTVQFRDNGVNIGTPVSFTGGVAKVTETGLTPGLHAITAVYSGDGSFNPSSGTLPGGQNVGFQFVDAVSGNTLIVTVPANGVSGIGAYTWLHNGVAVVSNVPAMILFNSTTLRIQTTSPALFALFDTGSHTGQAILEDPSRNQSYKIDITSFVLVSSIAPDGNGAATDAVPM